MTTGDLAFQNSTLEFQLQRMLGSPDTRPFERYGDVTLSVQAHSRAYCQPQQSGLPLEEYESVEVVIMIADIWSKPRHLGLPELDDLWESSAFPVGPFISFEVVERLRAAARAWEGQP
ncbi:hypothetical protein [Deinococcus peraridilitoris]|uniref:Uncharacterized protein n=1 Tax=Deinococcus peraridilitoris (strain DSM 19664 / LMG 22246 / CIP 109416 / KR-200) TaxID=937777 RepID=K9ZZA6_DEIPD|nr:hypothetical protein [Deinococcus peraridilitoris]AFZ66085.1 hypothetical protein Deipe_0489 [Deinococcus peraridilitoris DSM 19664]